MICVSFIRGFPRFLPLYSVSEPLIMRKRRSVFCPTEIAATTAVSVPAAAIFQSILPNNAKMKVLNWSIAVKSKSNTAFVPMTTVMRKVANAETT